MPLFRFLSFLILTCAALATPPANWSIGHKKVLIIPVRFTDVAGPSDTPSPEGIPSYWGDIVNGTLTAQMSAFMAHQSYGKCTLEFTVLPEIDMGVSYTNYLLPLNADSPSSKIARWHEPGSILDDIRARARQVGLGTANPALYDTDNYDLDLGAVGWIPNTGRQAQGLTYGKGMYGEVFQVLSHEIGHNLGLFHAWGWSRATFAAPLTRGTYYENKYANPFDLQGWKEAEAIPLPPDRDAGAASKYALGWLTDEFISTAPTSGTYRLHAFDQGTLDAGNKYAIRIQRDPTHTYWLEYRTALTGVDAPRTQNGLIITMGGESFEATAGNTYLIDTTPGTRGLTGQAYSTFRDAPLALGRTYTDTDMHITPVAKGGTTPESLDILINHGPFPGNLAPTLTVAPATITLAAGVAQTFTATATDPNGDTLAYYWEFDDPDQPAGVKVGGNHPDTRLATQATHTWTRTGTYLVRCTATDTRGGKTITSATVTITGGTAAKLTITGIIKDENGNPLAGAIVNNGYFTVPRIAGERAYLDYDYTTFAASGETAADGKYTIQLPYSGPSQRTYNLTVMYQGYTFIRETGSTSIPVTTTSITDIHWKRVRANRTIAGYLYVAGRLYDPAIHGPVTITAAGQSTQAIKATIRDYPEVSTPAWSFSIPDGTLTTITATHADPANTITGYFSNPHLVVANLSDFAHNLTIPGQMPETGFTTPGATTADTVGTLQIPVPMTLPAGLTSWGTQQTFSYWIDPASTAEYGVDYKMSGGLITYPAAKVPTPYTIPLTIIPNGKPKRKTVVIRLGVAAYTANPGPYTTYTHTIETPFQITAHTRVGNTLHLTWESLPEVAYTIETSTTLAPADWQPVAPHTDLPGVNGTMTRSLPIGNQPAVFYRIKAVW